MSENKVFIRKMEERDRAAVLEMMRVFYRSEAVLTDASDEIFERDITACVSDEPSVEGFVFDRDGQVLGYAMTTRSFSTEFGRTCIWLEDLYFEPEIRGLGLSDEYFRFVKERYPDVVFRLDAEEDNAHAIEVFRRNGFGPLPYYEMVCR